jgi:hypothetical protein
LEGDVIATLAHPPSYWQGNQQSLCRRGNCKKDTVGSPFVVRSARVEFPHSEKNSIKVSVERVGFLPLYFLLTADFFQLDSLQVAIKAASIQQ